MPALKFWFYGFAWVSAIAFILATIQFIIEIDKMVSHNPIKYFRMLLPTAILVSVALAWWVAAVQEFKNAPRILLEKDKGIIISMLKYYAPESPKVEVYYSDDDESQAYARQWEDVLKESGWELIEEMEKIPDHMTLSKFSWIGVAIKKRENQNSEDIIKGAPVRLFRAMERVGLKATIRFDKEVKDGIIRLEIGSRG